jgi:hypothetical protein
MIEASAPKPLKVTRFRAVAGVVVLVAAALVIWLVARGGNDSSPSTAAKAATTPAPAAAASPAELAAVATSVKHPVYWIGAKSSFTYELTKAKNGNLWVRYLPAGVSVGDTRTNFLTIGSYPQANAFKNVQATAKKKGVQSFGVPSGGAAVEYTARPSSVYVAYPGSNVLIEVYDPSPATARSIAKSGDIRPTG